MVVRLLSYNIHKGFSLNPFQFVLDEIKKAIQSLNVDIVFLQEVVGHHQKHSATVSQFEYLADTVWPHYSYGRNAVYDKGHHGNAILSKYPLEFIENRDISKHRFEQRGILHAAAQMLPENKKLHLFCLHFGLFEKDRHSQTADLSKMIEDYNLQKEPMLVAGDFNDWKRSISKKMLALGMEDCHHSKNGEMAKTYPSIYPALCLDRIYTKNTRILECQVLKGAHWLKLSDHRPLYGEIEI